ncbi:tRNA (5-methylaminomethyl-2-thiouridine)(34)-methyltransferase MnmD [Balneolaceae bacterium ANBcel3]|nr:tRNA (5-methylaminomethyl-2-thiouridine)(34)-methyltransferase MnmD [Balneolaceae bacterium ANBcel3]
MSVKVIQTRDGSPTLYSGLYDQHYHNMNGAVTESKHVFFEKNRLLDSIREGKSCTIIETGFGTGLHVVLLLWYMQSLSSSSQIHFHSIEKIPIQSKIFLRLGFDTLFPELAPVTGRLAAFFDRLSASPSGSLVEESFSVSEPETPSLHLSVYHGDFHDPKALSVQSNADFIFHDAFSPEVNPELWTRETFAKLRSRSEEHALLTTYCSATRARAEMVLGGWHVARSPGPPGKREMTLASPTEPSLEGYTRINEKRLAERFLNE